MPNAIPVVFQNSHFVAVNKPPLSLSVRSRQGKTDPRPVLWDMLAAQLQHPVLAIHRLDYEVGGLMLWALTAEAQRVGNQIFEQNKVMKTYLAISEGHAPQIKIGEWQEWKSRLLRGKKRAFESPHGKPALTRAKCVKKDDTLNWILQPVTGRSHQLRYELAKHECPIVGDSLYGAKTAFPHGIALQAARMEFKDANLQKAFGLPTQLALSNDSQLFPFALSDF
jgi:tRNA pseudouridine32 synthase / 23S rRNA pseudouridine746 synthase